MKSERVDSKCIEVFVSPICGSDKWSGRFLKPNEAGTDGPLRTLVAARNLIRSLNMPPPYHSEPWNRGEMPERAVIWLRGGRYQLQYPLSFGDQDMIPVVLSAWKDEIPILDGGRKIDGWKVEDSPSGPVWVVDLPEVQGGSFYFRSLFVNGNRRPRAKLPKKGWFYIAGTPPGKGGEGFHQGTDQFYCKDGDVSRDWTNLEDIEAVVLHLWVDEHMPLIGFDKATNLVSCSRHSIFALGKSKYYLENIREAMTEAGEWYLDRKSGRLYYMPFPDESPELTEIFAPILTKLVTVEGDAKQGFVQNIHLKGLKICHGDAVLPSGGYDANAHANEDQEELWPSGRDYAASPQAASNLPGAISFKYARCCSIERCVIENVGGYAVEIGEGCTSIQVKDNELRNIAGGGIKINGFKEDSGKPTGLNLISSNHIHNVGQVFHQGVGIFLQHTYGNKVIDNHIHDLFYTAISCGWIWGYARGVSRDNVIAKNHIHTIGCGFLSDMGGIYLLGVQPGTVVRGNLIHDVKHAEYGGWGIYLDEGSSHIVVENNIVYRTSSQACFIHVGRENILRNNIFAFGMEGVLSVGRSANGPRQATIERNVLLGNGTPIYKFGDLCQSQKSEFLSDLNLLWDMKGRIIVARIKENGMDQDLSFADWKKRGNDVHSVVSNPSFRDPLNDDFTFPKDTSIFSELGIDVIDAAGAVVKRNR